MVNVYNREISQGFIFQILVSDETLTLNRTGRRDLSGLLNDGMNSLARWGKVAYGMIEKAHPTSPECTRLLSVTGFLKRSLILRWEIGLFLLSQSSF